LEFTRKKKLKISPAAPEMTSRYEYIIFFLTLYFLLFWDSEDNATVLTISGLVFVGIAQMIQNVTSLQAISMKLIINIF
jgi:hypothetical protein